MAGRGGGGSKSSSLYAVLGVASDCSDADLRSAYRKLAMVGDLLRFLCFPWSCRAALFRSKIPTLLLVLVFVGRNGTRTSALGAPPAAPTRPKPGFRRSREPTPVTNLLHT